MNGLSLLKWILVYSFTLLMTGCMTGNVVRVTTVPEEQLGGLKEAEIKELEELKKTRGNRGIDLSLNNVIQETPHFSASEYIMEFPHAIGSEGHDYTIGGYDVLRIIVYEESDLSRDAVRVSADGYISFPLIGRIFVKDLTTSEIEQHISKRLSEDQYLLDPHVSVMVTDYNSKRFLVLGEVKNSGSYSLQSQERVLDAISRAGGISFDQAGKKGMIIRTQKFDSNIEQKIVIDLDLQKLLKEGDQIANIYLSDKDVLFVPAVEHFYIIGQVNSPGSYSLTERDITLVEAISMAGGFTQIASRNRTRIIRVEDGVEKIIEVKIDAITHAGKKIQDVPIRPDDIIVIPTSFF